MSDDQFTPPPGYEFIKSGVWQEGDLFWGYASGVWFPAKTRIGKEIPNYNQPAVRRIKKSEPMRYPQREGFELTEEGEVLYSNWQSIGGCSCHISAPCSSCTHEGNPISLEESDWCWRRIKVPVRNPLFGSW